MTWQVSFARLFAMNPTDATNYLQTLVTRNVAGKLILSVVVLIVLLLLRRAAIRLLETRHLEPTERYRAAKAIEYVFYLLLFLLVAPIWLEGIQGVLTFAGLLVAAIAVALREPIASIAAWLYILWRKPFVLGDRVEVDGVAGDVADIGPFVFSLMEFGDASRSVRQSTGRLIHIPNSFVFGQRVANASRVWAYMWHEIPVVITFESDWPKAKAAFLQIAERRAGRFVAEAEAEMRKAATQIMAVDDSLAPAVYTRGAGHGVELSIRFVVAVPQLRQTEQAIWEDILNLCARDPSIRPAYPTTRGFSTVLDNVTGSAVPFVRPQPPTVQAVAPSPSD